MVSRGAGVPVRGSGSIAGRHTTYAGLAEQALRAMVLDGRLTPGERLNEVLIAETLGISRGPLREAIQRLASEGLLNAVSHRGAYVATLTESELRELYEVRVAIESYAVRLGVERGTDEQLAGLRSILSTTREIVDSAETAHYPPDLDVHERLVALAQNTSLLRAMRDTHARLHLARARSGYDPQRARLAFAEHEEIVTAVVERDAPRAVGALEAHLLSSQENALLVLHQASSTGHR